MRPLMWYEIEITTITITVETQCTKIRIAFILGGIFLGQRQTNTIAEIIKTKVTIGEIIIIIDKNVPSGSTSRVITKKHKTVCAAIIKIEAIIISVKITLLKTFQ